MKLHVPVFIFLLVTLHGCNKRLFDFRSSISEAYEVEELPFEYLSCRTKFKFKSPKNKVRASASIRIRKDSLIWFSLTPGIGIEAARGKITQDSMVIIDKINKEVLRYSFETLNREFNFEFSFDLFQSVLIGEMPIPTSNGDDIQEKANKFIITQRVGTLYVDNIIDEKMRKLESLKASTSENDNTLTLKYADFRELNEKPFAFKSHMILNYFTGGKRDQAHINIEHKRVRIEEKQLKFPFIIPKSYERKGK